MKKIFIVTALLVLLVGCGEKSFKEIQDGVSSKTLVKAKVEYMDKVIADKKYNKDDGDKIQNLYDSLVVELKKEEEKRKIEAMLPPRDGFNGGVAMSVEAYLKENISSDSLEIINGGNTLRLTNGLFFQNVNFKVQNNYGNLVEYSMYFLISDNGYTSDSVVGVLESSNDFFDNYLKKNKIETAEDEVYNYYFGG